MGALEYSWQTRSDCTEAFNDQVDCKDSFTSAHDLNYYSMLWDGNYDLSNEKAYPFHMRNSVSISSSDDGIAFWLDDQAYFEYWLGAGKPAHRAILSGMVACLLHRPDLQKGRRCTQQHPLGMVWRTRRHQAGPTHGRVDRTGTSIPSTLSSWMHMEICFTRTVAHTTLSSRH